MTSPRQNIGFVAIGRNEGARLQRCLGALRDQGERVLYVDSGSRDDSIAIAKALGVEMLALSPDRPYTAARARNEGFAALISQWPDTAYVMFIDGDCELCEAFAGEAAGLLDKNQDVAIVTGRCRELAPDKTIYNRLCEMEWDGSIGEIEVCGGIFMVRASVFRQVGGFNESVIAAEDDEFCIRVRASGGKIRRIDQDMCLHDADIRRFPQWWRRAVRAGYAYGQVGDMHPGYFAAPRARAWGWGLALPGAVLALGPITSWWSLTLLGLYPISFFRTRANLIQRGASARDAGLYALFLTLSKFPNLIGLLNYRRKRLMNRAIAIVEYK